MHLLLSGVESCFYGAALFGAGRLYAVSYRPCVKECSYGADTGQNIRSPHSPLLSLSLSESGCVCLVIGCVHEKEWGGFGHDTKLGLTYIFLRLSMQLRERDLARSVSSFFRAPRARWLGVCTRRGLARAAPAPPAASSPPSPARASALPRRARRRRPERAVTRAFLPSCALAARRRLRGGRFPVFRRRPWRPRRRAAARAPRRGRPKS